MTSLTFSMTILTLIHTGFCLFSPLRYLQIIQIIKAVPLNFIPSFLTFLKICQSIITSTVGGVPLECSLGSEDEYAIPKPMIAASLVSISSFQRCN